MADAMAKLPRELVLYLAEFLGYPDLNAFARTNRDLYALTNPYLYGREI